MKRTLWSGLIVFLALAGPAVARVRLVPGEYPTIQAAINDCNDADTVVVDPGVHSENINFQGKNIVVTSIDPNNPEVVEDTIIDGDYNGSVAIFENGEGPDAVLAGFTITCGTGTADPDFGQEIYWGGGVFCKNSSPTITRNVFIDNHGPIVLDDPMGEYRLGYGGAIGSVYGSPIITHNVIRSNTAYAGAGIMVYFGNSEIRNNLIYDNSAYVAGGIVLFGGRLINNTFVGNDASLGGTGYDDALGGNIYAAYESSYGQCLIQNNIICNAKSGGGLLYLDVDPDSIRHNDVWGNYPGNYVSIDPTGTQVVFDGPAELTGLNGNISENPLFADALVKNYHLQGQSPCISTGDPDFVPADGETDIDGDPRIFAGRVDIGVDEYIGYVSPLADAGPDQHIAEIQLVTLDGSNSHFPDPNTVTIYYWEQMDGPAVELSDVNTVNPTFTPISEGQYKFELVVSDGMNPSRPDDVLVLVGNQPPIADAGRDIACQVPAIVWLDGTGSYDPDPIDELSYQWRQLEGPVVVLYNANTATPAFDCNESGLYVFELIVSDGLVDSEPSTVRVTTLALSIKEWPLNPSYNQNSYYHYPDICGTKVVYGVGTACDYTWDIKYRDLKSATVESFTIGDMDTQPKIDGDIVVWFGGPPFPGYHGPDCTSVAVRNLATGQQEILRQYSDTESYSHPVVSGDKVVWLEHIGINKNIDEQWHNTLYSVCGADISNLDNPVYFTIAENVGRRDPYPYAEYEYNFDDVIDISGNIVVWEAEGDIFGADISDLSNIRVFTICDDPERQYDPAISGDTVVWTDERNDSCDIYGADISDPNNILEFAIAKASGYQQQPAIDGNLIVYVAGDMYGGEIKVCCLTKQCSALDIPLSQFYYGSGPAISGERIVWQEFGYGLARGMLLEISYSVADGPVENIDSGRKYDYIQHAINDANNADRILVNPGTYCENVEFKGKNLAVRSANPTNPATVANTIIRSRESCPVVAFATGEGAGTLLDGFTITGGNPGIFCRSALPEIRNCVIVENNGPGIRLSEESNVIISNCTITNNLNNGIDMPPQQTGGGRNTSEGRPTVKYNRATINNTVIAGNQNIGIYGSIPTVINCTIANNLGCGIFCSTLTLANSIVYYNAESTDHIQIQSNFRTVTYSDVQGSFEGLGNMDIEPLFADPAAGDYHLKSCMGRWDPNSEMWVLDDVTSPCINAGDPNSDTGDEPAPNGNQVNMGAYGGTDEASKAGCFPLDHPDFEQWIAVGQPECWCYPRQCHGDADGQSELIGQFTYPVAYNDLEVLIGAWKKLNAQLPADGICADFDHAEEQIGWFSYRVAYNDLNILMLYWKGSESQVPDDCKDVP